MYIEFNARWHENALYEQAMRAPYMVTKYADSPARKAGRLRGLVIEHHVSGWFRQHYPEFYKEPDNFHQWKKMCSHDFKLSMPGQVLRIDVTGPRKDGSFGSYAQKPKEGVDFHIMARPVGFKRWDQVDYSRGFQILGIVKPEHYRQYINVKHVLSFDDWIKLIKLPKR
jgi:hypothetical protein